MATIGAISAPDAGVNGAGAPPVVVSLSRGPWSIPVRPSVALRWLLLALMVGNLGRIPVLASAGRDTSVVLNDVCVSAIVGLGLLAAVLRRSLKIDRVVIAALVFAAIGLGSAISAIPRFGLTPLEFFVSVSYLIRWMVYLGVYAFVINNVTRSEVDVVWGSLERAILIMTAFGIFQSIFLPGFAQMIYSGDNDIVGWDRQGSRLVSTILEPNIMASMIVLMLLVLFAKMSLGAPVLWWKPMLLLTGLAFTLSRSGVLGLIAGLLIILAARGLSIRLLRFFGVVMLLVLSVLPRLIAFAQAYARFNVGVDTSAGARLVSWALALGTVAAHPFFGVGFNTYGYFKLHTGLNVQTTADYGSDGGLLFVAAMTGLIGLAFFVTMLGLVIRQCRKVWRNTSIGVEHRGLAIGGAAGVVAIVINSFFANSILTTFVMEMMWVIWGLIFVVANDRAAMHPQVTESGPPAL